MNQRMMKKMDETQEEQKNEEEEVIEEEEEETTDAAPITPSLLETIAEDLMKEVGNGVDLSHLKVEDQVKTLMAMKKVKPVVKKKAPKVKPKPKSDDNVPPPDPDVPKFVYKPLSEVNGPNSEFMRKLHERKMVGGKALKTLFGDN